MKSPVKSSEAKEGDLNQVGLHSLLFLAPKCLALFCHDKIGQDRINCLL